jgi:hypothetical protein
VTAVLGEFGRRFPLDAYPRGWFQVAYSSEVTVFRAWARQLYEEAFA